MGRPGQEAMPCVMYSADCHKVVEWEKAGDWVQIGLHLSAAAKRLEAAGCSCVMIACNTAHHEIVVTIIESTVQIPLLHIADAAIAECARRGVRKVGLLGTLYTTAADSFFVQRLKGKGFEVVLNTEEQRQELHRIIFAELCGGSRPTPSSVKHLFDMIADLHTQGAEAVLLACTELSILAKAGEGVHEAACPMLDTAEIHTRAAVDFVVAGTERPEA